MKSIQNKENKAVWYGESGGKKRNKCRNSRRKKRRARERRKKKLNQQKSDLFQFHAYFQNTYKRKENKMKQIIIIIFRDGAQS